MGAARESRPQDFTVLQCSNNLWGRQRRIILKFPTEKGKVRTYKLTAALTATANNAANVLIARSGRIRCVRWETAFDGPADNAQCNSEISTMASSQLNTNDTPNVIDEFRNTTNLTTSGAFNGGRSKQSVLDYPVAAGERVYLNCTVTGTVSQQTTIFLDIDEK